MSLKVTVDINVLLDVFQKREPHYAASAQVMNRVVSGEIEAVFPSHGLTTVYYLIRKHGTRPSANGALDEVLRHFHLGNLDKTGWEKARLLDFVDFEDAVVAVVAQVSGSDFIVTRKVPDFERSPIPALTPTELLARVQLPE